MPVPDSRPGLRKGGDTAEASPRRPDLNGNRSRAPGALAARPDPVRSGPHLRSGPRKTVRISGPMTGTPRVPAAGPVAPSTGFPARLRPVPNRPSVTRKAQRPTGARGRMAPGRRTQPLPFPPATPRAEGGGGGTGGCWSTRPGGPPTQLSGSEAAAPPPPYKPGGSISRERSARRRPGDSGTIALASPASWNSASGTAAKYNPLPTSPTLQRGDAI